MVKRRRIKAFFVKLIRKVWCPHTLVIGDKGEFVCQFCGRVTDLKRGKGYRFMYQLTVKFQRFLWNHGINWHNFVFDECTPNFSCCWHKIPEKDKKVLNEISIAAFIGQPIISIPVDEAEDPKPRP